MPNTWWRRTLLNDWAIASICDILTGIFLYQFVIWIMKEDGLWLPETVSFVTWTLFLLRRLIVYPHLNTAGVPFSNSV